MSSTDERVTSLEARVLQLEAKLHEAEAKFAELLNSPMAAKIMKMLGLSP